MVSLEMVLCVKNVIVGVSLIVLNMASCQWLMFWQLSLKLSNYSVTINKVLYRILTSLRTNCFGAQTTPWELMFVTVLLAVCVPFSNAVHSKQFYYFCFFPQSLSIRLWQWFVQVTSASHVQGSSGSSWWPISFYTGVYLM